MITLMYQTTPETMGIFRLNRTWKKPKTLTGLQLLISFQWTIVLIATVVVFPTYMLKVPYIYFIAYRTKYGSSYLGVQNLWKKETKRKKIALLPCRKFCPIYIKGRLYKTLNYSLG